MDEQVATTEDLRNMMGEIILANNNVVVQVINNITQDDEKAPPYSGNDKIVAWIRNSIARFAEWIKDKIKHGATYAIQFVTKLRERFSNTITWLKAQSVVILAKFKNTIKRIKSKLHEIMMRFIKWAMHSGEQLVAKVQLSLEFIKDNAMDYFLLANNALNYCILGTSSVLSHVQTIQELYTANNYMRMSNVLGHISHEVNKLGMDAPHLRTIRPVYPAITQIAESIEEYHTEANNLVKRVEDYNNQIKREYQTDNHE